MAGRKRKSGASREPNGRAQRVYVNPKQQVMDQPHRVVVPVNFRGLQEAESEFGRLMILGSITPAQHEAGKTYAELVARYRSALMAPSPHPAAMDWGRVGKGAGAGMPDETATAISIRYDRAYVACGDAGRRAQIAVKDYVILEKQIPDDWSLNLVRCGLDALVKHFGIDRNLQITHGHK